MLRKKSIGKINHCDPEFLSTVNGKAKVGVTVDAPPSVKLRHSNQRLPSKTTQKQKKY